MMDESNTLLFDYEKLPYESYPFAETHPGHLAGVATMFGLSPAPVDSCKVLELGCAAGGNIIPLAYRFPSSSFMGIDLAKTQVNQGQSFIDELRLPNISLVCDRFQSVDLTNKQFDYIIAHGLFSWIDDEARGSLLTLCRKHLSKNGIAYISYNALPGWHLRNIVRDLLRYHLKDCTTAEKAVKNGRQLIDTVRANIPNAGAPESALFASLLNELADMPDWYVFHEFLEEHNTPLYFDHFVELAKGHGLRYLADSDLSTQIESPTSSSLRDVIATISTDSSKETQYADYLNLRLLRRALLVQEEAKVLDSPDPTRLTKLFIASPAIAKNEQPSIASDTPEAFVVEKRGSMAFTSAIAKAAFCHLSAIWPEGIKFEELHEAAIQLLPGESIGDLAIRTELSQAITDAFMCGAVNLDPLKPKAIKNPGAKPKVCPFVLAEARRSMRVTGARHQYLVLDGFAKLLIKLLDGTHSADDCFRKLKDAQVEIYDEERRRTRMMSLSRLEHAQFHEWYSLVIEEFSRRGLFVE